MLQVNNVAVLTVTPPIVYSAAISPVCLPPFNNAVNPFLGLDAAIMGWGTLASGIKIISWYTNFLMKRDKKNLHFLSLVFHISTVH